MRLAGLLALLLLAACRGGDAAPPVQATLPSSTATPATPTASRTAVAIQAAEPEVLAAWSAITDQRRDVLEIASGDVRRLLTGAITNWSALGGTSAPVRAYVSEGEESLIAEALGLEADTLAAIALPAAEVVSRVAAEPGAFALVHPARLEPGVLALLVDGHDPYRDPAEQSPLRLERAPQPGERADPLLTRDPVLMIATGELIPARCTHLALEAQGDHAAAFDATRDYLRHGDLTVTALEVALTDVGEPTPCVETFVLQGSPAFVDAMAGAGMDVVLALGNHMLDCWNACSGAAAFADTLQRLDAAGMVTVGAGEHLEAARTPRVVSVQTASEDVTFAFLGYDIIAPWNHAGPATPGIAPMDLGMVADDVEAATPLADHVIVGMNWGTEYTADPNAFQLEAAGVALDAGARLLIGNHPHWVQAVEQTPDGRLVAYALGNFVFDQSWSVETTQSAVLEVGFTSERVLGYRLRPAVLRGDPEVHRGLFRPELVDPAGEGRPILERIWEAADRLPSREAP